MASKETFSFKPKDKYKFTFFIMDLFNFFDPTVKINMQQTYPVDISFQKVAVFSYGQKYGAVLSMQEDWSITEIHNLRKISCRNVSQIEVYVHLRL